MRAATVGLVTGLLAILFASSGQASLHHPTEPFALPVNAKGVPEPLRFDELARQRVTLRNASNPAWPLEAVDPQTKQPVIDKKTGKPQLTDRGVVAERIKKEQQKQNRTLEDNVALAVDLLRFGRPDDAEGALGGQRQGFLPNITLAHIAIAQDTRDRPGWPRAFTYLDIANEERPPKELPGISPQQLAWQIKLNRGALLKLVKLRWDESKGEKPPPPENELPDRIFDVNFVNNAGAYEPGALADAEKAKLPGGDFKEAIATVQQLVLWFPNDIRLYWLLGELYAAKGEFTAAKKIMDECVDSGHYSNRKVLMQHREAVTKLAKTELPAEQPLNIQPSPPPEQPDQPGNAVPFSLRAIWIYFGAVAAVALFAFVRSLIKKRKDANNCGPVG